ncbi:MAG: BACON domain-containing protein, partial [Planctomycetota bacterium]
GYTWELGAGATDVYLIKTDALGNEEWSRTFGGGDHDEGQSVQLTSDGGYIITGWTYSFGSGIADVWLIKTDGVGNEQWSRTFGGSNYDRGMSVQLTGDGGYIIGGNTSSFGAGGVYLIKTDAAGIEQWSQTIGGGSCASMQITGDGGYIATGYTYSYGAGDADVYLVKTDALGNEQWSRTFGGSNYDRGFSVQVTDDGGYIIAGRGVSSKTGTTDVYLIKTSGDGGQGALIGYLTDGRLSGCMVRGGSVTGTGDVGSLVGWSDGLIEDCYSTTTVNHTGSVGAAGGLIGKNDGQINRCYAAGAVDSNEPDLAGGLVGSSIAGMVTASFWDTETSGQANSAGGTGLTTGEMYMESTYAMLGAAGGWDLSNIWTICDGYGYPYLRWEGFPPCIDIPNNALTFSAISKEVNPDDQTFTIINSCEGILNWSIDKPAECDWLNVSPLSNNSNPDVNEVTVSIEPSGLDYGLHSCELTISDPNAQNSPQYVTIDLEVLRPELSVSPGQFYFETALDEPNNSGQVLSIQNTGHDTLHWDINVPDEYNWLTFSESSGQTDANETDEATLTIDHNEVGSGYYEFEITVSDPNADNNPQTVSITVRVFMNKGQRHVPAEYETIWDAVNAAVAGDEVILEPGTYSAGNGISAMGKPITIRSIDPQNPAIVAATIINGLGFRFTNGEGPNTVVDGLTITSDLLGMGSGVWCWNSSPT